ncbi:MAG: hypothetical protein SFU91_00015, partial [Chloroherpetonaceae bacterium]|nr:hypothetical protein [Chloroherpetonaceae bacterium]
HRHTEQTGSFSQTSAFTTTARLRLHLQAFSPFPHHFLISQTSESFIVGTSKDSRQYKRMKELCRREGLSKMKKAV